MNEFLENLLADLASGQDIKEAAGEYLQEIAGHFANDPVADFGQESVDQVYRLCNFILEGN